jgi:hypothetical protein
MIKEMPQDMNGTSTTPASTHHVNTTNPVYTKQLRDETFISRIYYVCEVGEGPSHNDSSPFYGFDELVRVTDQVIDIRL